MKVSRARLFVAITVTVAVAASLTQCGDDSPSTDDTTEMQIDTAAPTETAAPVDTTVAETTAPTTAPTTAAPVTTAATPASAPLPAVQILGVASGAGGGEAFVLVDKKPEGWAKFNVSMSATGIESARVKVLYVQETASGINITVNASKFFGVAPVNVSVSWTNDAGVKSDVASLACSVGITQNGC